MLTLSMRAALQSFVNLRHPSITNIAAVTETGLHLDAATSHTVADDLPTTTTAVATIGFAAAQALSTVHAMGFSTGPLGLEDLDVAADGTVSLRISAAVQRSSADNDHRTDVQELIDLLLTLLTAPRMETQPDLTRLINTLQAVRDEMPCADRVAHECATTGAAATLDATRDETGGASAASKRGVDAPLQFLEPRPSPANRPPPSTRVVVAAAALTVALVPVLWLGGSSTSCAEPLCNATYDRQTAELSYTTVDGQMRSTIGQAGDALVVGDIECDGTSELVLFRPSTHEVFVFQDTAFAAPTEAHTTRASYVAPDLATVRREVGRC